MFHTRPHGPEPMTHARRETINGALMRVNEEAPRDGYGRIRAGSYRWQCGNGRAVGAQSGRRGVGRGGSGWVGGRIPSRPVPSRPWDRSAHGTCCGPGDGPASFQPGCSR